jgi:hypothetical protein
MSQLRVGDWTVIAGQIMEVTGFTPDGTVVVRPLAPSTELAQPGLQAGWAGEGVPVPPVTVGPPILCDSSRAEILESIREAMRIAKANPGREVIFDMPQDPPEE